MVRSLTNLYWALRANALLRFVLAPTYRRFRYSASLRTLVGPAYRQARAAMLAPTADMPKAVPPERPPPTAAELDELRALVNQLREEQAGLGQRQEALARELTQLDALLQRGFALSYLQLMADSDTQAVRSAE